MQSFLNWGYLRIPLEIVNNLNFIIANPEKGPGNSMFYPFSEGCGSGTALNSTDLTTSRFSLVYADIPRAVIYFWLHQWELDRALLTLAFWESICLTLATFICCGFQMREIPPKFLEKPLDHRFSTRSDCVLHSSQCPQTTRVTVLFGAGMGSVVLLTPPGRDGEGPKIPHRTASHSKEWPSAECEPRGGPETSLYFQSFFKENLESLHPVSPWAWRYNEPRRGGSWMPFLCCTHCFTASELRRRRKITSAHKRLEKTKSRSTQIQ